jgi:hypothetical protein
MTMAVALDAGEQPKAAEAKAICAFCQARDHCLDLAIKTAGGIGQDHGLFGALCQPSAARFAGTHSPSAASDLAEAAHTLVVRL